MRAWRVTRKRASVKVRKRMRMRCGRGFARERERKRKWARNCYEALKSGEVNSIADWLDANPDCKIPRSTMQRLVSKLRKGKPVLPSE